MKPRFRSGFSITEYLPGDNILNAKIYFRFYKRRKAVKATLEVQFEERYDYYTKTFEATSVCHPQDDFDLNVGLDLALKKVINKFIKSNEKDIETIEREINNRTTKTIQAVIKRHNKMKDKKIYQFQ